MLYMDGSAGVSFSAADLVIDVCSELISALLHKNCHKKQETVKALLKKRAYNYHQGTFTPQGGT